MDDFDFSHVLDGGDAPAATPDVLRQVLVRRRRQQMRRYRVVATSAIVVALAGAGIGVGLNQAATTTAAAAPAGLKWDTSLGRVATGSAAEAPTASGAQPTTASIGGPEPGEFGFVSSDSPLPPSGAGAADSVTAAIPAAASTDTGGGVGVESPNGCKTGCDAVYLPNTAKLLFTSHLDGITLRASLISFAFPLTTLLLRPRRPRPTRWPHRRRRRRRHRAAPTRPRATRSSAGSGSGSSPGSTGSGSSTGSTRPGTATSPAVRERETHPRPGSMPC